MELKSCSFGLLKELDIVGLSVFGGLLYCK